MIDRQTYVDSIRALPTQRVWTGGAYPHREAIHLEATENGLAIRAWYDGGIGVLQDDDDDGVVISWNELRDLELSVNTPDA